MMRYSLRWVTRLCLSLGLSVLSSGALAVDEVLEVEIFNATPYSISPGEDFSLLESPDNSGHDFIVESRASQELLYYLPESRGTETFTYRQGEQACLFGFGHLTPGASTINRWANAKSIGPVEIACAAELLAVPDHDEFVRNGGTRVLFTMG